MKAFFTPDHKTDFFNSLSDSSVKNWNAASDLTDSSVKNWNAASDLNSRCRFQQIRKIYDCKLFIRIYFNDKQQRENF